MINQDLTPKTLSISCVVYDTDPTILATTIVSLKDALETAIKNGSLDSYKFSLISNQTSLTKSFQKSASLAEDELRDVEIISGHGNIGYGRANNLVILKTTSDFHLILNPDVKLDALAIHEGLTYLITHQDVDLVAPNGFSETGELEYLCKRMPTPLIIFLRGINNHLLNRIFKNTLDRYTYRDKLPAKAPFPIELASGCFMLCRTRELKGVGGFSPEYLFG